MRKWFTVQSGERFSRWTVLRSGQTFSSCRCDCGYVANVRTNNLMTLPGWNDDTLWLDRTNNNGNYEPGNLRWVASSVSRCNQDR